jgi:hypothetical protein
MGIKSDCAMTRGRVHTAFTGTSRSMSRGAGEELRSFGRNLCFLGICLASARPAHIQDLHRVRLPGISGLIIGSWPQAPLSCVPAEC